VWGDHGRNALGKGDRLDPVQESFEASYRRLVGQLYGVCGDLAEAEDVVAEAFVRAVSHRGSFEAADNREAWLRTVAVNVARTRFRRRSVASRLHRRAASGRPAHHPELSSDRLALVSALAELPLEQREALALHYLADLPLHEIAIAVGAPLGTVKARLSRGRKALAALLDSPELQEKNHV